MLLAALQMVSTPDVARNLADAATLLHQAADAGAQLAALPEYFCLLGRRDTDKLDAAEDPGRGPIQDMLAQAAQRHKLWVVGGTLPIRAPGEASPKALNRCIVYSPAGEAVAHYDKIHLFAYDNGNERYDEGRTLQAGHQPVVVNITAGDEVLRLGLSVCYDLRFPELYRALMRQGAPCDVLAVPSAFTHTTGQAHWELLLRARAVENQCYVLAPAQGGTHENGRRTWGHSLVAGPWGEVLACRPEGAGVVLAECSAKRLAEVRRQLPALGHQRL